MNPRLARWLFPVLVFVPTQIWQLPLSTPLLSEPGWQIDLAGFLLLGTALIWLRARTTAEVSDLTQRRARIRGALAIVVGALLVTGALMLTQERYWWWASGVTWVVAVTGAFLASQAGDWPEDRGSFLLAWGCGGLALFAPLLTGLASGGYILPLTVLMVSTAIGIGFLLRAQRRQAELQREEVRDSERRAMAAELHDVIAHEVTGMVVLAQAVGQGAEPQTAEALARIERAGQRALDDIRDLISTLRDTEDHVTAPLAPVSTELGDLEVLVGDFAETTSARVHFTADPVQVASPVAIAARRVLSEALTNVRRHAGTATEVWVTVRRVDRELVVAVTDNGTGGGLGSGHGSGLSGIRERVELLGGQVTAGPVTADAAAGERGWQVRAEFPHAVETR